MRHQTPAILYFGNDWDAENRTSSHHIAMQLNLELPLIYVECPGLRKPSSSGRDLRKIAAKLLKAFKGVRRSGSVSVYTLLQLPFHENSIARAVNRRVIAWQVAALCRKAGSPAPILWFVIPHLAHLPDAFPDCFVVYYCVDKYAALPGVDAAFVTGMDDALTRRADAVFVASEKLLQDKIALRPDCLLSPHGVDFAHFSAAADKTRGSRPADLPPWKGGVIGFFGLIETWIDLELIAFIAAQRPALLIVLIGRQAVDVSALRRYRNIVLTGRKAFADLPDYGRFFDVAILPYRLTEQVIHSNPIKLREYLAMGTPVVSVRFPHADGFADTVRLASSHEEFVVQIDAALTDDSREASLRRMAAVRDFTWKARATAALGVVTAAWDRA